MGLFDVRSPVFRERLAGAGAPASSTSLPVGKRAVLLVGKTAVRIDFGEEGAPPIAPDAITLLAGAVFAWTVDVRDAFVSVEAEDSVTPFEAWLLW